jgi:hypothetical protein
MIRVGPFRAGTLNSFPRVRVLVITRAPRWIAMFTITRSGSFTTNLSGPNATRTKKWTAKRDHRRRMQRWAAHDARAQSDCHSSANDTVNDTVNDIEGTL